MTSITSLNPSRIAKVIEAAQSGDSQKATEMGFLDKIIDFFKGGVKRKAIENIFNSIQMMQLGTHPEGARELLPDFTTADNEKAFDSPIPRFGLSDTECVDLLIKLREYALPEHRHQFKFDVHENLNGLLETRITIADKTIYCNDNVSRTYGDDPAPKLFMSKFQIELEDIANTGDAAALTKTLNEMGDFLLKQIPSKDEKGKRLSVEKTQDLVMDKMSQILAGVPSDARAKLIEQSRSDFGSRLRGVLRFGYDVLTTASSNQLPIQVANSSDRSAESPVLGLMMNAEDNSHLLAKPLALEARYNEVLALCAESLKDETEAIAREVTLSSGDNNPVFVSIKDVAHDKPLQSPTASEIKSHTELADAEVRILNLLGIPDSLLRLL